MKSVVFFISNIFFLNVIYFLDSFMVCLNG